MLNFILSSKQCRAFIHFRQQFKAFLLSSDNVKLLVFSGNNVKLLYFPGSNVKLCLGRFNGKSVNRYICLHWCCSFFSWKGNLVLLLVSKHYHPLFSLFIIFQVPRTQCQSVPREQCSNVPRKGCKGYPR